VRLVDVELGGSIPPVQTHIRAEAGRRAAPRVVAQPHEAWPPLG
jgi:hypothetical protein